MAAHRQLKSASPPSPLYADVTRLLRRHVGAIRHTGIDRVSLEYGRWVHEHGGELCIKGIKGLGCLSRKAWSRFLLGAHQPGHPAKSRTSRGFFFLRALAPRRPLTPGSTLFVTTHSWLGHNSAWKWLATRKCRTIVFVHDLIPIQFPEYSHPREKHRHTQRMRNTVRHAAAIIVNSECTASALRSFAQTQGLPCPPILVNPLGHDLPHPDESHLPHALRKPYFVVLGTIEPRKNHLLLLTLWREMAVRLGDRTPQLVVVGRRGWECEQVVDMLERCETIHPHLLELNNASDELVAALIKEARALLMPSFAEGFGMPVQEALAWGIPVITTPLPAIREFAGDVPEYAEPHDGCRWLELIESYARTDSPQRDAQLERLGGFRDTRWRDHFAKLEEFLASLATT